MTKKNKDAANRIKLKELTKQKKEDDKQKEEQIKEAVEREKLQARIEIEKVTHTPSKRVTERKVKK